MIGRMDRVECIGQYRSKMVLKPEKKLFGFKTLQQNCTI